MKEKKNYIAKTILSALGVGTLSGLVGVAVNKALGLDCT